MNSEKQLEIYKQLDEKIWEVASSKRHDYADEDVLKNFKSVSAAAKELKLDVTTPTGYALFMVMLKIQRIANLTSSGKEPKHEAIDDSFEDGINYFKLAYCCFKDN